MLFNLVVVVSYMALNTMATTDKGMIAYFYDGCPDGWTNYTNLTGRIPIGAGNYTGVRVDNTTESKTYTVGEFGGEIDHTLTLDELANHNHGNGDHKYMLEMSGLNTFMSSYTNDNSDGPQLSGWLQGEILSAGNDVAHNNLQPYLILYYIHVLN